MSPAARALDDLHPTSRDYGFGIPGVNASGTPGVICDGPGANDGGPGMTGAFSGFPLGGIPSVGKTGALQKPSGAM
jgi:hypothetical protein